MATAQTEDRITKKDLAEMAISGMADIMKEAKDPTLLKNYLQTSAHNINLSASNKAVLAVQAPGARNVMTYDGIKYKAHNSVRKGEKAVAYLMAPKKSEKGSVYFGPTAVFASDQLTKTVDQPTAEDLRQVLGSAPRYETAGLTAAMNEIADAAGELPEIGNLDAKLPAQTAALMLQYRHDMPDAALESKVTQALMKPDRGMPTGEFVRSCKARQGALEAGDNIARLGNAVINRVAEIQKENPAVTLNTAMKTEGENGKSMLYDIALEVTGGIEPKAPEQYQVKKPAARTAKAKTASKAPKTKTTKKKQQAER